jgi:HSP20 family molecular chaperone IbpA
MGSMKLDLRSEPKNFQKALGNYFSAAFGPSPALYRHVSLCGWRPLMDPRTHREKGPLPDGHFLPGIAVYETDDGMTIEVALSRIKEESLHLAVSGQRLIIRGERIDGGSLERSASVVWRSSPLFQQLIRLPETVNPGGFRAQVNGDIVRIDFARRR